MLALAASACGGKDRSALERLEGRAYVIEEAGYRCQPMDPTASPISSYRDSVRFANGAVCQTGDACSDLRLCAKPSESELDVAADLSTVTYAGRTYVYSPAVSAEGSR